MSFAETVAVVIPAYNEEDSIAGVVATVPEFVRHIIVVDDDSSDLTFGSLKATGDKRLRIVSHNRNSGVGAAIVTGYREALSLGADAVAVMGGDGQMDPRELRSLVEPVLEGEADYAKGNRFMSGKAFKNMPFVRYAGNLALSILSKPATGYWRLFDSQCGYTVISGSMLEKLPLDRLYPRYGFPNDLLARLNSAGATVAERPVTPIYNNRHSHMRLLPVSLKLGFLLLRIWMRRYFIRNGENRNRDGEVADVCR